MPSAPQRIVNEFLENVRIDTYFTARIKELKCKYWCNFSVIMIGIIVIFALMFGFRETNPQMVAIVMSLLVVLFLGLFCFFYVQIKNLEVTYFGNREVHFVKLASEFMQKLHVIASEMQNSSIVDLSNRRDGNFGSFSGTEVKLPDSE